MAYKASVIIPVYNAEKTLRRCIESVVLGQEKNIEVILVDDCSKDHSKELCLELAQEFPGVTVVQNERNSGVSFTRNRGLELAQGDYVLFVDSDDWVSERYVRTLLCLAESYPLALPVCGQHFIDKVHNTKRDYTWDENLGAVAVLPDSRFFELSDKFLLQQLWNKIFRRDVIESTHIRFDETQSMGEDFQFVLDYMEAARVRECVALSEPLYYYIRWNDNSLMSKFGLLQNTQEYQRIEQLYRISGMNSPALRNRYLNQTKLNYVYHLSRNPKLSRKEKLAYIEQIMADGHNRQHYMRQKFLQMEEELVQDLCVLRTLPVRVKNKFLRMKRDRIIQRIRSRVRPKDVTIISQNCIGGVFYHDLGAQFLSPTINLFIKEPDFVRFAGNLRHYMECELEMRWEEEYPVGRLDDIEIHFMHYETCKEAKEQWNRRKQRINWDKIIVLSTDREGFDDAVFQQWKQIPYPKVLFTAQQQFSDDKNSVFFPQYREQGYVADLIPQREFYKDDEIFNCLSIT